jgi:hypothetical protein
MAGDSECANLLWSDLGYGNSPVVPQLRLRVAS